MKDLVDHFCTTLTALTLNIFQLNEKLMLTAKFAYVHGYYPLSLSDREYFITISKVYFVPRENDLAHSLLFILRFC